MSEPYIPGTEIPFEGGVNFRELGGYPAAEGRRVRRGLLYRGMTTAHLTSAADQAQLEALGLKLILDLRSANEAAREPNLIPAGARQVRLCGLCADDGHEISFGPEDIQLLHSLIPPEALASGDPSAFMYGMYAQMLHNNRAYKFLFETLEKGEELPLLFHCSAGKDRTGVAAMLILMALGAEDETMLDDYELTNVYRRAAIEALLAQHAEEIAADPAEETRLRSMMGVARSVGRFVLNAIRKRHGSYEAYLLAEYGLDAARLQALRERYLEKL